jgi:hypothetical protein
MRDRLIGLLDGFGDDISLCDVCHRPSDDCEGCKNEQLADYLIANGVTLPACKVGDKVYALYDCSGSRAIRIDTLRHLEACKKYSGVQIREKRCAKSDLRKIGKTVFLTNGAAERAAEQESNHRASSH